MSLLLPKRWRLQSCSPFPPPQFPDHALAPPVAPCPLPACAPCHVDVETTPVKENKYFPLTSPHMVAAKLFLFLHSPSCWQIFRHGHLSIKLPPPLSDAGCKAIPCPIFPCSSAPTLITPLPPLSTPNMHTLSCCRFWTARNEKKTFPCPPYTWWVPSHFWLPILHTVLHVFCPPLSPPSVSTLSCTAGTKFPTPKPATVVPHPHWLLPPVNPHPHSPLLGSSWLHISHSLLQLPLQFRTLPPPLPPLSATHIRTLPCCRFWTKHLQEQNTFRCPPT